MPEISKIKRKGIIYYISDTVARSMLQQKYTLPIGGIPKEDMSAEVQGLLEEIKSAIHRPETDPTVPEFVKAITQEDIINWNNKLSSFTEQDPTVPDWAKNPYKPTYTASEVGALPDSTVIPVIPTKVSAFINDAGYLTSFTEADPTVPAYIKAITQQDIANWNSKTSNIGTITGITMNGVSKGTSGIVDLGTVLTSHQSLAEYATTQYVDDAFSNLVGSAPAVLDTLEELAAALGEDKNFATTVTNQLSNKVDKVSGKGLSTNDYTTADRDKLAGIAAGAEVNVNADWNATGGDAQILNKPTLFSGDYNDLTNKPSIPSAYDDTALSNRIDTVETGLQDKADASDVYTKSEVDTKTAKTTARGDNKLLYNGQSIDTAIANVGISTSNNLLNNGFNMAIRSNNSNPFFGLKEGSNLWYAQAAGNYFYFGPTSTKALRLDQAGNGVFQTGSVTANSFIKKDGTAAQFLKADGSVDTNTYLTQHQDISGKVNYTDLATVATSGSYDDLSDKPVIPDLTGYATTDDVDNAIAALVSSAPTTLDTLNELAQALGDDPNFATTMATALGNKVDKISGKGLSTNDYTTAEKNKLAGIAAGAEVNVNADWNATSGDAKILNKPNLATVATSGSYNDLSNKPTIPAAYDDTTLSGRVTALENAGFLTAETDPSVPSWAKQSTKPTYTASEVGALPSSTHIPADPVNADWNATSGLAKILNKPTIPTVPTNISAFNNDAGYLTSYNETDPTVPAWAKASTKPSYTASEVGALPDTTVIPTKTSQLNNDSGFLTSHQDISGKQDKLTAGDGIAINNNTVRTTGIPFGRCDSTSTSTVFTATVPGIYKLEDGVCCMIDNGVVTSASGFTLNVNGLGAKPVYNSMAAATRDTTIFNANYTMLFVYDETRVEGGCWVCYRGYDANTNTIGYQLRTNSTVRNVSDTARYYKIYFTSADGTKWVPASVNSTNNATAARPVNQRPIDPFGRIVYTSANTNYAAGANLTATAIWDQYNLTLGYSFNRTGAALTLTSEASVYLKCAPQTDGSAIMDADTPIVQALPTANDGKIYIFLGVATSATAMELVPHHPVYYHDGTGIRLWTGSTGGSTDLSNYYTKTEVDTALSGKQAALVSGTNIKTINNESLLGSGNIDIQGGSSVEITYDANRTALVIGLGGSANTYTITFNIEYGFFSVRINGGEAIENQSPISVNEGDSIIIIITSKSRPTATMGGESIAVSSSEPETYEITIESVIGDIIVSV